jgi:hypothetical protein
LSGAWSGDGDYPLVPGSRVIEIGGATLPVRIGQGGRCWHEQQGGQGQGSFIAEWTGFWMNFSAEVCFHSFGLFVGSLIVLK